MIELPNKPKAVAIRLNKLLDQLHAVHGGDRFPVDVEALIPEVPNTFQTGEPIAIQGEAMDPEFEGALFNLDANEPGKGNWAIIYNQAISSPGRIRFTLAHELGHYLVHRHLQASFNCSEVDTTQWDSEERQIEFEANTFASYLLMPADDYRRQIQGATIDLDVLGACADRYGVSMTSAILKWLELTPQRAVLVMSQHGIVQWACGSETGKWLSIYLNKRQPNGQRRPLPAMSASRTATDTNVDRMGTPVDARIWFPQEPTGMVLREMRIASDLYRQTMTLLVLPAELKPWERDKAVDDDDGLENTFDRFVRNGQPPIR